MHTEDIEIANVWFGLREKLLVNVTPTIQSWLNRMTRPPNSICELFTLAPDGKAGKYTDVLPGVAKRLYFETTRGETFELHEFEEQLFDPTQRRIVAHVASGRHCLAIDFFALFALGTRSSQENERLALI